MSIIIFATLSEKGVVAGRVQVVVGWDMPEPNAFRATVIWEIINQRKFAKDKLPAFDTVTVPSEGVVISRDAFEAVFSFRSLVEQGADPATVLNMVRDHKAALEALDRSAYDLDQNNEWADAVCAANVLISQLEWEVARG